MAKPLSKHASITTSGDEVYSYSEDDDRTGKHYYVKCKVNLHTPATLASDHTKVNKKVYQAKFRKLRRGKEKPRGITKPLTSDFDDEYEIDEESEGGCNYKNKYKVKIDKTNPKNNTKKLIEQKLPDGYRYSSVEDNVRPGKLLTSTRNFLIDCHKENGLYNALSRCDNGKWSSNPDEMVKDLMMKHFWLNEKTDRQWLENLQKDVNNIVSNNVDYDSLLENNNLMKHHIENLEIMIENLYRIIYYIADNNGLLDDLVEFNEKPYKNIVYQNYKKIASLPKTDNKQNVKIKQLLDFYTLTG